MSPSSLKINPEPTAVLTRLFNLKGSIEIAVMETTAGETCLKSSGSGLLHGPEVVDIPTEDVKRNPTKMSKVIAFSIASSPYFASVVASELGQLFSRWLQRTALSGL